MRSKFFTDSKKIDEKQNQGYISWKIIKGRLFSFSHNIHKPNTNNNNKSKNKHTYSTPSLILTHNPDEESG